MSRRGAWQLERLVFSWCKFSGSSKGAREFQEAYFTKFQQDNPHLPIERLTEPGCHPRLKGYFRCGRVRQVGLRNSSPDEILRQANMLRNSVGRITSHQIKQRQVFPKVRGPDGELLHTPQSVQGAWRPAEL
ncbi:hypothetical protein WJX73_009362 [Symbiochloris irregularis]|uniref:Large ribosomal subunit protein mL43 n=1 Tax=Symbiochloris irregularis TaxID=706552 RepID=A0AAW1NSM3_9CHLO